MAINVTETRIPSFNTATEIVGFTGASVVNGAADDFEISFPCADEKAFILIDNAGSNTVTAKLLMSSTWKGSSTTAISIGPGKHFAITLESAVIKNSNGKLVLRITPPGNSTVSASMVKVYAAYQGVTAK
ncbi:MAG: hypothetical protein RRY76_03545 [Clostridia bacterium]